MISSSCSHPANLHYLLGMAGRTLPMTGIDRTRLSSPTVLILLVLLVMPRAARCDTLEDSARELAREIDAVLTNPGEFSCDIRNVSKLDRDEVVRIERAIESELQGRCAPAQAGGSEAANVVLTLSENIESLVWTAEIHQGAVSREILRAVPRPTVPPNSTKSPPFVLASERFWEGPERILDAAVAAGPTGDRLIVLLFPASVTIRNVSKDSETSINVPLGIPSSNLREPTGSLSQQNGNFIDVSHQRHYCTISLSALTVVKCWDDQGEMLDFRGSLLQGGQVVHVATNCSGVQGIPSLVTGTGDDTQPDSVRLVVLQNLGLTVASNRIDYSGPVVAIHEGIAGGSATVILKNLHTGNYEAYRLSISCGP